MKKIFKPTHLEHLIMKQNTFLKSAITSAILLSFNNGAFAESQTPGQFDTFLSAAVGSSDLDENRLLDAEADKPTVFRLSTGYTALNGLGGQIDVVNSNQGMQFADVNVDSDALDIAGHLFYRTETFQIGGFYQKRFNNLDVNFGDPSADFWLDASIDRSMDKEHFYGVEGMAFLGDATISGMIGKHKIEGDFFDASLNTESKIASLDLRYFANDNLRIDAGLARESYDEMYSMPFDAKTSTYSLGVEYRLQNNPLSLFANYSRHNSDFEGLDLSENVYMVGVKVNFGSESLKNRDRMGVNLDPIQTHSASVIPGLYF